MRTDTLPLRGSAVPDAAGGIAVKNAMSVDVEDYFQVSAFERHIRRDEWDRIPGRVEANTERILSIFSDHGVKATFFVLGWVAERHPSLVRAVAEAGHEVASHGYSHVRVFRQTPAEFQEDVVRTKKILEDASGCAVIGYRAASYSIDERSLWALQELERAGYRYSSSIYPIRHDLYGMPQAPRFPFYPNGTRGFLELPISTVEVMNRRLPCGGGGFFRLLPYGVSRWAIRRVNSREERPCIFYFHPWEIDPRQPRQRGLSAKTRFRHYLHLDRMEVRLQRLLTDFSWDRIDHVFPVNEDGRPDAANP